jgi:hypothetical protein
VTTPLSPAAQAVRNAYHEICEDYIETWLNFNHNRGLAAVLRAAAADRVVPEQGCQIYGLTERENERQQVREEILAIAAELEANAQ